MSAVPQQATPGRDFYHGVAYALIVTAGFWAVLAAIIYSLA